MEIVNRGAGAAGRVLEGAFRGVGALRRGPKALHPRGQVATATWRTTGGPALGVPLLDEPGETPCLVRISRATGLPRPLPDIFGLAVRVPQDGAGPADLLFASTGLGRVSRFVLLPRTDPAGGPLTTLLPMSGADGPVLLGLRPEGEGRFAVLAARGGREWQRRGELRLGELGGDDPALRFHPVAHTPVGLRQYAAVARLRRPAYAD